MKHLFTFYLIFIVFKANSQPVTLQLKNKISGEAVEYAYVVTKALDGSGHELLVSNDKGEVQTGSNFPMFVHITCIGYKDFSDTVTNIRQNTFFLSPDYYKIDNVVVTGQSKPVTTDKSIYNIDVISSRQIELNAANNMGDLIKTNLNMQFINNGVLGNYLRIQGLTGNYIKILINGMPVTGGLSDIIDLDQLPLDNVDHIEIVKGPMSVIYGSSALAGAINIITKDNKNKSLSANAGAYYESTIGTYNFNAGFSKRYGKSLLSVNAARNFISGWGPVDTSRFKLWRPKRQYLFDAGYMFNNDKLNLVYNTDYLNEELRNLDSLSLANLYEKPLDSYYYTTRWNNNLMIRSHLGNHWDYTLQGGYSFYRLRKITYLNDLVNLKKNISDNPQLQDTTSYHLASARGIVNYSPVKEYELQLGLDMNHESCSGKRIDGFKEITDMAAFMNLIYKPFNRFSFQPGLRLIYNSKYNAPLVYAFNAKYSPGSFDFRASWARGFRAPGLKELYFNFIDSNHDVIGNPELKAETADIVNLSGSYNHSWGRQSITFNTNVFYNTIRNAIQLAIDTTRPGWGTYFNFDGKAYKTKGLELKLQYSIYPFITLRAGTVTTGRLRLDRTDQFVYSTDFASSLQIQLQKYQCELDVSYKYTDKYLDFAGDFDVNGQLIGILQQVVNGYNTLDITIVKNLLKNRLAISSGIKNIFNVTLVNSVGYLDPHSSSGTAETAGYGRSYFLKISYHFDKY